MLSEMLRSRTPFLSLLAGSLLLTACEGELVVDLGASARDDDERLVIATPSVDLLSSDGDVVNVETDSDSSYDLLEYSDGDYRRLISEDVEEDESYIGFRVRFDDDDAYLRDGDGEHIDVNVSTQGEYSYLDIDLGDSDSVAIVIELELRFSLIDYVNSLGEYELIPVIRAVNADTAGTIEGTIDDDLVEDDDCRDGRALGSGIAVYLYEGADITPVDYVDSGTVTAANQPIGAATVIRDDDNDTWAYRFRYVTPGSYTVALTCEADDEDPTADDDLVFTDSASVSVESLGTVVADF